jgi:MFS family permease
MSAAEPVADLGRLARDRRIVYATAFTRALGTGMVAVLLAAYLAELGFGADVIGYVVSAGLAGNAIALLLVTLGIGRRGRRESLLVLTVLWIAGASIVATASHAVVLAAAAFLGMVNGAGRDRGAALALEQAILPDTTNDAGRTQAFAWYSALQDAGHAIGALLAGIPVLVQHATGSSLLASFRATLWAYVAFAIVSLALYARLSPGRSPAPHLARLSPRTRRVVTQIAALFALDSLGGGFLTTTLLSYFFFERFGAGQAAVAVLFFGARVANALSHFGAAALARRIGLVKTMVLTHMPSSLLLVTVAIAPSFAVAATLFLLREGLVEMDVPTRQSYVMALVRPEERTVVSAVTNLVRMAAWAIAPLFAGTLMQRDSLMLPLIVGAVMKIAYDALLYVSFRRVRPPEERSA